VRLLYLLKMLTIILSKLYFHREVLMLNLRRFILIMILVLLAGCDCKRDISGKDRSSRYNIVCIDGHVYYERYTGYEGFLAIKLDAEGKPLACDVL